MVCSLCFAHTNSQDQTEFLLADAWAQLEQEFPLLDDDANPALIAIVQRYKQHQPRLEECYKGQYMPLEPAPEAVHCEHGTCFEDQDRNLKNAVRINRQLSKHHMLGALHGLFEIYEAGAPFERLFSKQGISCRRQHMPSLMNVLNALTRRRMSLRTSI